ncbi:hypothetical protein Hanom_Chr01g00007471 [Helianthus anomalus]
MPSHHHFTTTPGLPSRPFINVKSTDSFNNRYAHISPTDPTKISTVKKNVVATVASPPNRRTPIPMEEGSGEQRVRLGPCPGVTLLMVSVVRNGTGGTAVDSKDYFSSGVFGGCYHFSLLPSNANHLSSTEGG